MARADQFKALLRAYAGNEESQFLSVALQVENAVLKKNIGNQALELEFKTELLKKPRPTNGD